MCSNVVSATCTELHAPVRLRSCTNYKTYRDFECKIHNSGWYPGAMVNQAFEYMCGAWLFASCEFVMYLLLSTSLNPYSYSETNHSTEKSTELHEWILHVPRLHFFLFLLREKWFAKLFQPQKLTINEFGRKF